MPEPEITREDIVIVVDVEPVDEGGYVNFTSDMGSHKLNKKHNSYAPLLIPGKQVKLCMAKYQGYEYIHKVIPTELELEGDYKEVAKPPASPQSKPPEPIIPGQQIGMTVKEVGDMIRSQYIMRIFGQEAGMELIKWYRGQILGTTRVDFDGAKLPNIKDKEV